MVVFIAERRDQNPWDRLSRPDGPFPRTLGVTSAFRLSHRSHHHRRRHHLRLLRTFVGVESKLFVEFYCDRDEKIMAIPYAVVDNSCLLMSTVQRSDYATGLSVAPLLQNATCKDQLSCVWNRLTLQRWLQVNGNWCLNRDLRLPLVTGCRLNLDDRGLLGMLSWSRAKSIHPPEVKQQKSYLDCTWLWPTSSS